MMEDEDRTRRKRGRDVDMDDDGGGQDEFTDSDLEFSLKKVRISKQFSGAIRLQQDVSECSNRSRELGIEYIKVDPKNPLHLMLRLSMNREYSVTIGKFYPHQAPVVEMQTGARIWLPVLENWVPIHTLADIIQQLNTSPHGNPRIVERQRE